MDLSRYHALQAKVDAKFQEIRARRPEDFACRKGCHSCCVPGITVFAVEQAAIQSFFDTHPERLEAAKRIQRDNPHGGERCAFLEADGGCVIYEARPLVCRSHGAPLGTEFALDVCPLNFTDVPLETLPTPDVIRLETLNTLLALVNRDTCPGDEARYPLRCDAFT